jgi:hypothetical protein
MSYVTRLCDLSAICLSPIIGSVSPSIDEICLLALTRRSCSAQGDAGMTQDAHGRRRGKDPVLVPELPPRIGLRGLRTHRDDFIKAMAPG